ncbi:MAG: T9SS type A sorting domain-containing protein, partial [Flavobacteriales bacterium]
GGGRVDWAKDGSNLIAFDFKIQADGYFDVYTMRPDTSLKQCITCGNVLVPQKHNGQPAWHPSGNWIVFQAEKAVHPGLSTFCTPGKGVYNDLWVITPDGTSACQLTNLPVTGDNGVLHPHFSNDGTKLSWSQLVKASQFQTGLELGSWILCVADFNGCSISNIQTFMPGDSVFYENHGFSHDDSSLVFTSNFLVGQSTLTYNNIYTINIYTQALKQLTSVKYNEHATYIPGINKICWGTNKENQIINPGMDYWIMNPDSSNKQRITYFNKPGHFETAGNSVRTVDHSWNATGDSLVAYVGKGSFLAADTGDIYILKFNGPLMTGENKVQDVSNHVLVYPNPLIDKTTIEFNNPGNEIYTLALFNNQGQHVRTITHITGERAEIERENLAGGLYFYRLQSDKRVITGKLMVK